MASESPLVVVVGTGTDVGKTHVATAVLRAWGVHAKTIGYKPVETGVGPSGVGEDARSLAEASTFHVKHPPLVYRFAPPSRRTSRRARKGSFWTLRSSPSRRRSFGPRPTASSWSSPAAYSPRFLARK